MTPADLAQMIFAEAAGALIADAWKAAAAADRTLEDQAKVFAFGIPRMLDALVFVREACLTVPDGATAKAMVSRAAARSAWPVGTPPDAAEHVKRVQKIIDEKNAAEKAAKDRESKQVESRQMGARHASAVSTPNPAAQQGR
jgi:hypothetical protein